MKIELNNSLKTSFNNGNIKTVDVITFLIDKGFKTASAPESTSLNMLSFNNKQVKSAYFKNDYLNLKF